MAIHYNFMRSWSHRDFFYLINNLAFDLFFLESGASVMRQSPTECEENMHISLGGDLTRCRCIRQTVKYTHTCVFYIQTEDHFFFIHFSIPLDLTQAIPLSNKIILRMRWFFEWRVTIGKQLHSNTHTAFYPYPDMNSVIQPWIPPPRDSLLKNICFHHGNRSYAKWDDQSTTDRMWNGVLNQ